MWAERWTQAAEPDVSFCNRRRRPRRQEEQLVQKLESVSSREYSFRERDDSARGAERVEAAPGAADRERDRGFAGSKGESGDRTRRRPRVGRLRLQPGRPPCMFPKPLVRDTDRYAWPAQRNAGVRPRENDRTIHRGAVTAAEVGNPIGKREGHFQLQLGMELLPVRVSWRCWVPSANMDQICV